MKRLLCILLLGLLILGSASAGTMREYTLTPFHYTADAMLALTFGDRAADARLDKGEYSLYRLSGDPGPYCGQNDTYGFGQMDLSIYTEVAMAEKHEPDLWDNVEPSGVAKCALTPEHALAKAEGWLAQLGVSDGYLQGVTAYGRLDGLADGYMIAFGQSLDGVPVYWAASTHVDTNTVPCYMSQSNRIEVLLGDSGLVRMSGFWSDFIPARDNIPVISDEEAVAAFAKLGEAVDSAELCYLLTGNHDAATAIPAYRWRNRFISAENGAALQ